MQRTGPALGAYDEQPRTRTPEPSRTSKHRAPPRKGVRYQARSNSNPTGQWSLPYTSSYMHALVIFGARESLTKK